MSGAMAAWEEYFAKQTPPRNLKQTNDTVCDFAANHRASGRNVVLITSGGTRVPLESNAVRYVDNFSSGTRGAASAEYFLELGYAVIYLHRQGSLKPFTRHTSQDVLFDSMDIKETTGGSVHIEVDQSKVPKFRNILKKYKQVQSTGALLLIEFCTLSDYLFLLRTVAKALGPHGPTVMFYLAAAVSDFYVPDENLSLHKIQSDGGPMQLSMHQAPKIIGPLVKEWAAGAFVVSFKLETDVNIISKKAREALKKYAHQVVISNILQTRKKTVVIVTHTQENAIWMSDGELEAGKEIEQKIVTDLIRMHQEFITAAIVQGTSGSLTAAAGQLSEVAGLSEGQVAHFYAGPQEGVTPEYFQYSAPGVVAQSSAPAGVTHIRLRKGDEQLREEASPKLSYEEASGTNPGKSHSRFGVLTDACLTPEMKSFIETFRARRIALGHTQEDVGNELSRTNGPSYSQSFISRFESKNLGLKAAEKMKPVMQSWIEQKELECAKGLRICKKRKRRTSFSAQSLAVLTAHFEQNPKPSSTEIAQIAEKLGLEPVTVRVWFCNRKQMYKRMVTGKTRIDNSLKAKIEAKKIEQEIVEKEAPPLDFTNMPVGQFSFTEDRVKPLVCLASEGSPVKCPPTTSAGSTSTVTYAQVQDDTIVHSAPPGFLVAGAAEQESVVAMSTGSAPTHVAHMAEQGVRTSLQYPAVSSGSGGMGGYHTPQS